MNRKRVRWALAGLIVLSLGILVWQLRLSFEAQKRADVGDSPLSGMLPHAVQWIQNFHRVEIKDGKKAWEVEADEAQYLEEREQVIVRRPRASFFLRDGEGDRVTVRSDNGQLKFRGRDLHRVALRDNVEIHVRDFVIRTDNARYDRDTDRIVARGPVEILGAELEVRGRDMIVFMKDSRFELREQVRVTVVPGARNPAS